MSIVTGRLSCPKCNNNMMIGLGNGSSFERACNRYRCMKKDGNELWNFAFSFDEDIFNEDNKTEEEWNQKYTNWMCLNVEFSGDNFSGKGCGYSSSRFSDFIPKS